MKKPHQIVLIALTFTVIAACKKEGCTDSDATNYDIEAKKDDGTCIFPQPDPRDPYLGNYWVTDTSQLFQAFYEEQIYTLQVTTGGTVSDTIYLNNLWNDGVAYIAIIAGTNFSIPSQQVSGPYYASGYGNFANDVITYHTSGDVYINDGSGPRQ